MSEQLNSIAVKVRKHGKTGLTIHLSGFVLGFVSIGLVLGGVIDIESGIAVLAPFADLLYAVGLVIVVATAARADIPMKYLVVAGAVIGVGLFYKSSPHEIHIASGIGFGLPHNGHIVLGTILITISVIALAVLAFVYTRFRRNGDRRT
ncbi:MAG TPA: hypothetical protein VLA68_06790 [Nitrososphaera sp.]|nr:hypothetical protein [Nitrososphaera sp.]